MRNEGLRRNSNVRAVEPNSTWGENSVVTMGRGFEGRGETGGTVPETESERKRVTLLFSELSVYTATSQKLDPEEVKEIMSRIFGEIAQVVARYEGLIEKFVGDVILALFRVPQAHEDDPVRAILAVREIQELVEAMSPQLEKRIVEPSLTHTGINTGLVVTGQVDLEKGGDSIYMEGNR